ncbi:hypothetical protein [Luteimonas suaedae]|uniref:hypothetical protein n=1 Tax=Luteimonas suaedae TaxID=2605430 RepID=UPI0011ED7BF8|nr:hypothetical protein [Luteimonas suaedae]
MTRRARHRLRIALVVVFCLLFQQAALAVYFCPTGQPPAEAEAMVEECAKKGMEQAQGHPSLCHKHCNPDRSTAPDIVKLSVPPLALPAPAMPLLMAQPVSHAAVPAEVPMTGLDPPPRLRFCSLLI